MAERWARTDAGGARLANMFLATRDPDPDLQSMIDVIGQPRGGWEMGQLFAMSCIFDLWTNQALAVVELMVGITPTRDADRAGNQERLNQVKAPFVGHVDTDQHGAEGDGTLSWTSDISASLYGLQESRSVTYGEGSAPIEIGSTDASMSPFHLVRFGTLARYPYGHNVITLLITNPLDLLQRARWYAFEGGRDGSGTATNGGAPILDDLTEWANLLAGSRLFGKGMLWRFEADQFVQGGVNAEHRDDDET